MKLNHSQNMHPLLLLEMEIQVGRITWAQASEYQAIYAAILMCKKVAGDSKCGIFCMCRVPLWPEYQKTWDDQDMDAAAEEEIGSESELKMYSMLDRENHTYQPMVWIGGQHRT